MENAGSTQDQGKIIVGRADAPIDELRTTTAANPAQPLQGSSGAGNPKIINLDQPVTTAGEDAIPEQPVSAGVNGTNSVESERILPTEEKRKEEQQKIFRRGMMRKINEVSQKQSSGKTLTAEENSFLQYGNMFREEHDLTPRDYTQIPQLHGGVSFGGSPVKVSQINNEWVPDQENGDLIELITERIIKKNGQGEQVAFYHCKLSSGQEQDVPARVVTTALVSSRKDIYLSAFKVTAQRAVAANHIQSLENPDVKTLDDATIKEAERSQVVTTESLTTFVAKKAPEKKAAEGADQDKINEIESYNKRRQEILVRLADHTEATSQDFADVMSFCAPLDIQTSIAQVDQAINVKLQQLSAVRGTTQEEIIEDELKKLRTDKEKLGKALELIEDPQSLQQFFDLGSSI